MQEACRAAIGAGCFTRPTTAPRAGSAWRSPSRASRGRVRLASRWRWTRATATADELLFGEGPSRVVVSVAAEAERHFEQLMGEFRVPWRWIGRVGGDRLVIRTGGASIINLSLDRVAQAWRSGFEQRVG